MLAAAEVLMKEVEERIMQVVSEAATTAVPLLEAGFCWIYSKVVQWVRGTLGM
jgi:hypothetical protein